MASWVQRCGPLLAVVLVLAARPSLAANKPSLAKVKQVVEGYFAGLPDHQPNDLISQSQVVAALAQVKKSGWKVPQAKTVIEKTLPNADPLVKELRSEAGKRYMRKVSTYKLIYDRLDRVARVNGGQRMIHDLARLPDGERYAPQRTSGAIPDFLDLLPKVGSGRTRTIKDYEKPTGRIYTVKALLNRLAEIYKGPTAKKRSR